MSTTTLVTLSDASKALVSSLTDKLNNRKDWLLSEIVSVYKADAAITPQHLLVGIKGKANIGAVFAAWYAHKSGISTSALNITLIGENYSSIVVKSDAAAMTAELARVAEEAKTAKRAANQADNEAGKAFKTALDSIKKGFDLAAEKIVIRDLESQLLALKAKVGLNQQETTPLVTK